MKPGNLVKITRAGIGVPIDTIGFILNTVATGPGTKYHEVHLCDTNRVVRRLERDLEVVNASR